MPNGALIVPITCLSESLLKSGDCLDRNQAQQRFGNILYEYFESKSIADKKIRDEYKSWISSVDYIRFWSARSQSNTLLKTELGCSEVVDIVTEQRLKSLQTTAASSDNSSGNSSAPNEPTSLNDTMLIQVMDYLISIMTNFVHEEDTNHNPWMFKDTVFPSQIDAN